MPFSIINKDNQKFFLGSGQVFGVQSIAASYGNSTQPLEFIGSTKFISIPAGVQAGKIDIASLVANTDPFIKCISNSGFNGFILKDSNNIDDNYSFYSGYLTSYTSSCSVGNMPETSVSFVTFGDVGRIPTGSFPTGAFNELNYIKNNPNQGFINKIASPTSVEITLDEFQTSLVNSYSLSINIPRKDFYLMGNRFPYETLIDFPIEVTVSFEILADSSYISSQGNLRDYPCKRKLKNFEIKLKEDKTDSVITSFSFSGIELVSESYSINTDDNLVINAEYRSFLPTLTTSGGNITMPNLTTYTP